MVAIACRAGSCGVAAGRAVWKEAVELKDNARMEFLRGQDAERMRRLTALVNALAPPYASLYQCENITYKVYYKGR